MNLSLTQGHATFKNLNQNLSNNWLLQTLETLYFNLKFIPTADTQLSQRPTDTV
jgi:hypothetical protein